LPVRMITCKWGFTDSLGNMIIKPEYDNYEEFLNGYAPIMKDKKLGIMDSTGKVVVQPRYDRITPFQGNVAFVKDKGLWGAINHSGIEIIAPRFSDDYRLNLPKVPAELKAGYYPKFDKGYATVFEARKYGLVDSTGKVVAEPKYDKLYVNTRESTRIKAIMQYKKKWGAIDAYGLEVIKPQFISLYEFTEGLARVATTKYGYIDETGNEVIGQYFEKAGVFEHGWAPVAVMSRRGNLKFFLIDSSGTPMPIK
jgi:hypothetical protein